MNTIETAFNEVRFDDHPRQLSIDAETTRGASAVRVRFRMGVGGRTGRDDSGDDSGDAPEVLTRLRVTLPLDVLAVELRDIELLIRLSSSDHLPPNVVRLVTERFAADAADNAEPDDTPFGREARWAETINTCVALVSRRRPTTEQVARSRSALFARIVDQFSADRRLTPEAIAAGLGVSRRTLYVLAEPLGGVSGYIRTVRAVRALGELQRATSIDLATLARNSGFSSVKQMRRAVSTEYGETPQQILARARSTRG